MFRFKWDVPVWYQEIGSSEVKMVWMKRNEPLIIRSDKPILLNAESEGFYRTGYSESLWNQIVDTMKTSHSVGSEVYRFNVPTYFQKISPLTRVRLIDDAFTQATAGILNYSIPLGLISYLKGENDYLPWSATLAKIKAMASMYGTDPEKDVLYRFTISMSEKTPSKRNIDFVSKNYKDDKEFFPVLVLNS